MKGKPAWQNTWQGTQTKRHCTALQEAAIKIHVVRGLRETWPLVTHLRFRSAPKDGRDNTSQPHQCAISAAGLHLPVHANRTKGYGAN